MIIARRIDIAMEGLPIEAGKMEGFELATVILRGCSGPSQTPASALHYLVWE